MTNHWFLLGGNQEGNHYSVWFYVVCCVWVGSNVFRNLKFCRDIFHHFFSLSRSPSTTLKRSSPDEFHSRRLDWDLHQIIYSIIEFWVVEGSGLLVLKWTGSLRKMPMENILRIPLLSSGSRRNAAGEYGQWHKLKEPVWRLLMALLWAWHGLTVSGEIEDFLVCRNFKFVEQCPDTYRNQFLSFIKKALSETRPASQQSAFCPGKC